MKTMWDTLEVLVATGAVIWLTHYVQTLIG